ncbi:heavy metal translocating P-type ATPase [Paenirhodobacter enshiensis]|uniref:heavy metal translocating P-type ATPase n=1 Tax=Paenirhodobacter enshiensis TaxID=1105367 RepID=UPI003FA28FB8
MPTSAPETETETEKTACEWRVSGMDCAACASRIRGAVERLPGVADVELAVMSEKLKLNLDETATSRETVEKTVRALGYGIGATGKMQASGGGCGPGGACHCHCDDDDDDDGHGHDHAAGHSHSHGHSHGSDPEDAGRAWYRTAKGRLVLLSGAVLALAWGVELFGPAGLGTWAFGLACLIGLVPVARSAGRALRMGQPFTIEGLMTIAALGALLIGATQEAALVVFLFAVGEVLEGVAADRARDGIRALSALIPRSAMLEEGGTLREVPADSLTPGQIVLVRPGERVPADGEIVEGVSSLDESPVTGESIPQGRGPGDAVPAGAINTEAALRLRVSRAAADNTIARIVRMVEEAEAARAPTERFIDRFSRWYMPAVIAIAALVIVVPPLAFGEDWMRWIYRGLSILLIGCPCALVISVPASIASALSTGARRGLLMKGGAVVEATAHVRSVAFDKTGTLTLGRPEVTDVISLDGTPKDEALALAAAVEAGSTHPLARAVSEAAKAASLSVPTASAATVLPGRGVRAEVAGETLWLTSPLHALEAGALDATGLAGAEALEAEGKTTVALFREGRAIALIALRDEPRPDAAEAMRQLRALGIVPVVLTGDNPRTAAAIAGGLGIEYRARMLPEDKLAAIRDMSASGGVMMIGDGINDAPALKQATVGVAMGSGTDVALETADAAILRDRVCDVAAQIRLARAAMANVRQNVGLALGLKAVFLVTSVAGITGLWPAIMADTGATVLVTLNALRMLRYDPSRP